MQENSFLVKEEPPEDPEMVLEPTDEREPGEREFPLAQVTPTAS